jgi:hypothetical protein
MRKTHSGPVLLSILRITMSAVLIAGLQSCGTPSEEAAAGQLPVLRFAAVADVDERKDVEEYPFAGDTIRLRTPRSFAFQGAWFSRDQAGFPAVMFVIADSEKEEFREWTGSLVDHQMAMLVDGRVIAVPKVRSALPGAGILVDERRHWTAEEASELAERIRDREAQRKR